MQIAWCLEVGWRLDGKNRSSAGKRRRELQKRDREAGKRERRLARGNEDTTSETESAVETEQENVMHLPIGLMRNQAAQGRSDPGNRFTGGWSYGTTTPLTW